MGAAIRDLFWRGNHGGRSRHEASSPTCGSNGALFCIILGNKMGHVSCLVYGNLTNSCSRMEMQRLNAFWSKYLACSTCVVGSSNESGEDHIGCGTKTLNLISCFLLLFFLG